MKFRFKVRSVRFRLTVLFVLIFGSTLIGLSIAGYQFFVRNQQFDFDTALFNRAVDVASAINLDMFGRVVAYDPRGADFQKIQPFPIERSFMQVRSANGIVIGRSSNLGTFTLPLSPVELQSLQTELVSFSTIPGNKMPSTADRRFSSYRHISYFVNKPGVPPLVLQIAAPMSYVERANRDLRYFLLFAIPSILIIATISGYDLSRRGLAPVLKMISKAEEIGVGQISSRIPVPSTRDEIHQLAVTFNKLLDRMESSVRSNERFVANASHQLKTPLAILRGELELIRKGTPSQEELDEFLTSADEEIQTLSSLIEKLLILASVDAGTQTLKYSLERIDEIAIEVFSSLESLAKDKNLHTRIDLEPSEGGTFEFQGDAGLIRTVLQAVFENAIKYSSDGGQIQIQIKDFTNKVTLAVSNTGPGIEEFEKKQVFDRFYRARKSEASGTQGFGLGLAIAKRIVDLHGGYIGVESVPGSLTVFTIVLQKKIGTAAHLNPNV